MTEHAEALDAYRQRETIRAIERPFIAALEGGMTFASAATTVKVPARVIRSWMDEAQRLGPASPAHSFYVKVQDAQRVARQKAREQLDVPTLPTVFAPQEETLDAFAQASALYFTNEIQERVVLRISNGATPRVAAEAAGVPFVIFSYWLEHGSRSAFDSPYYKFYQRCLIATASARAEAEERVHEDNPLAWLMKGPVGRDRPGYEGWTDQKSVTGPQGGPIEKIVTHWKHDASERKIVEGEGHAAADRGVDVEAVAGVTETQDEEQTWNANVTYPEE